MRTVCHFVTISNDSSQGGLQETVDRVATRLAANDDLRVVVYTMEPASRGGGGRPYAVEDLSGERAHLAAPLMGQTGGSSPLWLRRLSPEGFQINRLLLLARMQAIIGERPSDRHVVVSFFLTSLGFTAQLVAQERRLPHVAFIAGSDLNRDVASPAGMAAAAFVVEHADWIVASNRDQATRLERLFKRAHRVSVWHGALPEGRPSVYWKRSARDHVTLVSDCGYSFKKSTHSLVEAFGRLRREGHPVKLTLVGRIEPDQAGYWETARREWRGHFRHDASFGEYVPKDQVEGVLLGGDIYCSASLGEGSPNGALFALALGMPVVAPRSSSLADIADPAIDRVSLFRGGDREDFYRCLAGMVARVRQDPRPADRERTEALRRQLWEAEARDWLDAVGTVARGL